LLNKNDFGLFYYTFCVCMYVADAIVHCFDQKCSVHIIFHFFFCCYYYTYTVYKVAPDEMDMRTREKCIALYIALILLLFIMYKYSGRCVKIRIFVHSISSQKLFDIVCLLCASKLTMIEYYVSRSLSRRATFYLYL